VAAHRGDHPHHPAGRQRAHPHHGHTRTLAQIRTLIRGSALPEGVRERGEAVFTRLAEAEARVHHSTAEAIHFHEVGGVDSIIDVVGTVYALHLLGVERVTASPVPSG